MDRRKDTAAYASLPLSTMSKSKCLIPKDKNRTPTIPDRRRGHPRSEAPRHKLIRTAPPMKRFYPKPFPRSTLISKNFLEIFVAQPSSFSIRTSLIVRKSVFAFAFISFKSKISIRKLLFFVRGAGRICH